MRALRFHEFGGPEVLRLDEGVPVPEPSEGQVLVRVAGAGVNPIDWKIRQGYTKGTFDVALPAIVGFEFSGTIEKLGPGVSDFSVGDEVYGGSPNSCADYVVAAAKSIARKPVSMDLVDAGGVPVASITAWQALFNVAKLQNGQKILVQAASGGVGSFAVQLAKWAGAYVAGTASANNRHLIQELGVDEAIDYKQTDFSKALSGYDAVLETIGGDNFAKDLAILKPGGVVVSLVGPAPQGLEVADGKRVAPMSSQQNTADLEKIANLIQDVILKPVIDTVVPFREAIELQKLSQEGHLVGKSVVNMLA